MTAESPKRDSYSQKPRRPSVIVLAAIIVLFAGSTALLAGLLVTILQRKQEAKDPYLRFVNVKDNTTDPAEWGKNWPREYEGYLRTVNPSRTKYGGGATSEGMIPPEKAASNPWLTRMFAGYAFAIDYRDRRGHAYMLTDQENTKRTKERKQPGSCLHCHASIMPLYRLTGAELAPKASPDEQLQTGFVAIGKLDYWEASVRLEKSGNHHPISCVDCHDPRTMQLRVTRPGFINGIKALKSHEGISNYDPNRDASRQEMRSYVCGQCHVEYYFKGDQKRLVYPWAKGLKIENIQAYYDEAGFKDFVHKDTGANILKAQHPEFELWNQGIHARSGVACADCHMPYMRQGGMKISDHQVNSPLLKINRSCQTCHHFPEEELKARVEDIQDRFFNLRNTALDALVDLIGDIKAEKAKGATDAQLASARDY